MSNVLYIGLGGFFGAMARWGLSGLAHKVLGAAFPWGTLLVNVLGCLLIGGIMFLVVERRMLAPQAQLLLITGFLGSLTTFSTFGYETMRLANGGLGPALANVGANCIAGLTAVWLGWNAVRLAV